MSRPWDSEHSQDVAVLSHDGVLLVLECILCADLLEGLGRISWLSFQGIESLLRKRDCGEDGSGETSVELFHNK